MRGGRIKFSGGKNNYWNGILQKNNNYKRTFQSDTNNSEQYILFLIWPFLALINCLGNRNSPWAKNIFWLFCIYFGYTFVIAGESADAFRYAQQLIAFRKLDLSFSNFFTIFSSEDSNYVDLLQPLVTFILSRFTNDSRLLFATFGMIFGFFFSRNLWLLFDKINIRITVITSLYIIVFALINPIWNINGFRFWTAAQVFLYGVFLFLINGNRQGIWIAASSVLIHFSFMFPVLLLLIYTYAGNRVTLYFILFIFTSFINEIDLSQVKTLLNNAPDFLQGRVNSYVSKDVYIDQLESLDALKWFMKFNSLAFKWIAYVYIIFFYFKSTNTLKFTKEFKNLFCFSMLFYSYCNIVDLMPQGIRFYSVGNLLIFFLIIVYITKVPNQKIINILKILTIPFLLFIIVMSIRRSLDSTGLLNIFGNPFFSPFIKGDFPLIEFYK